MIKPAAPVAAAAPVAPPKNSQGLMDRIIDNIKFELKELRVKLKLRGKHNKSVTFELIVQDIEIKSTNSKWQVVDLKQVHTVDRNGHVIMYKEIDIGRFSFNVYDDAKPIAVLAQLPIRVRTKTKKSHFRGPTINHAINLDVLEQMKLKLHSKQFKLLQNAVDALLECMGRATPASDSTSSGQSQSSISSATSTPMKSATPDQKSAEPSSYTGSLWGRFASAIGSYAGYGAAPTDSATTSAVTSPVPAPEGNSEMDIRSAPKTTEKPEEDTLEDIDSDSDEEYRDAESEVPTEELADVPVTTTVSSDEDITHTSYTLLLRSGVVSLSDYVLEERGIAELEFSNLRCSFEPTVRAVRPKMCFDPLAVTIDGVPMSDSAIRALETELVEQTKISITIDSYGLNQLQPSPDRHPEFTYLLKKYTSPDSTSQSDSSSTDTHTLNLSFAKFPDWKNPANLRREAELTIASVALVADMSLWERLWVFFFGGSKGEKFAQYMQENLGQMLEAALTEQVHFKFNLRQPTFLLPPYASKFVGKPHLASKVLRLHADNLTVKSIPVESSTIDGFSSGLFVASEFPAMRSIDFSDIDISNNAISSGDDAQVSDLDVASPSAASPSSAKTYLYPKQYDPRDPLVMTERKFECSMTGMWIDIQADPTATPERVLKPFDLNAQMTRREFQARHSADEPLHLPRWTPQLEGLISLSEIGVAFSPSQYTFLLAMWNERLNWNPNQVTEEMREAMKMEFLLEAAESGAEAFTTSDFNLPPADDPPLLMRIRVFVPKVHVQLLERADVLNQNLKTSPRAASLGPKAPSTDSLAPKDYHSSMELIEEDDEANRPDSPSSTIHHGDEDDEGSNAAESAHVVLADMEFMELAYILESHAERSITKVSSSHFNVSSPVHADSPFSKLVAPLVAPLTASKGMPELKDALLVRMERFKDEAAAQRVLASQADLLEQRLSEPQPLLLGDQDDSDLDEEDKNAVYLFPTSAASPVMNVRLHGMQVCWIYSALAEVQVFFTRGEEVPVHLRGVENPYILKKNDSGPSITISSASIPVNIVDTGAPSSSSARHPSMPSLAPAETLSNTAPLPPPSLGMNWVVLLTDTELVVVETPDTPECMPMGLLDARVERRGVSIDETQFDFFGNCIISSEMWQSDTGDFARKQLTTPFNMEVAYIQERNKLTGNNSTNMEMLIDDMHLTINRKQLIMIQNILDNQMADIRDVGAKREAEKASEVSKLANLQSASASSASITPASAHFSGTVANLATGESTHLGAHHPERDLMKLSLPNTAWQKTVPSRRRSSGSNSALGRGLAPSSSQPSLSSASVTAADEDDFNPRSDTDFDARPASSHRHGEGASKRSSGSLTLNTDLYKSASASSIISDASSSNIAVPELISDTLVRALRNRFQVGIQKMTLNLLDPVEQPIAAIRLDDFLYSTENWSDVNVMLIEGGILTITSMKDAPKNAVDLSTSYVSPYAMLLQPRLSTSIGGNEDAVSVTHAPTLIPVIEKMVPGLSSALDAKLARLDPDHPDSSFVKSFGPSLPPLPQVPVSQSPMPSSRFLRHNQEMDSMADLDARTTQGSTDPASSRLFTEHVTTGVGIPINGKGDPIHNYGSISASPMLNSFVMLSPMGSLPSDHGMNASAPNSAKISFGAGPSNAAPRSYQIKKRGRDTTGSRSRPGSTRYSINQSHDDGMTSTLSSSASASRLQDLSAYDSRFSQTYQERSNLETRMASSTVTALATPARSGITSRRPNTPFPASGRDPQAMFAHSLRNSHGAIPGSSKTKRTALEASFGDAPANRVAASWVPHSNLASSGSSSNRHTMEADDMPTSSSGFKTPSKPRKNSSSAMDPPSISSMPKSSSKHSKKRGTIDSMASPPPKSLNKRQSWWTDESDPTSDSDVEGVAEAEAPVLLNDGRMFSLKFETIQRDFKGERENPHAKWMSRWLIGFAPFDIVYDSDAFAQLQDFFALMAEHKNLRHRYQEFQTEVIKVYREQGGIINEAEDPSAQMTSPRSGSTTHVPSASSTSSTPAPPSQPAPAATAAPSFDPDDGVNRVALNILISGPRLSMPQPLEEESKAANKTLLSVLEFSLDSVRVSNAANAGPKTDNRAQTKIVVSGARCFMKTVELGVDESRPVDSAQSPAPTSSLHTNQQQKPSAAASSLANNNTMDSDNSGEDDDLAFGDEIDRARLKASDQISLPLSLIAASETENGASTKSSPKTLGAIALQTQELARPLTANIVIEMKPKGASGRPFMHVSCDIDMLAVMISIKRYQLLMGLINKYVLSFFKRARTDDTEAEYGAWLQANNNDGKSQKSDTKSSGVDKVLEFRVKTVNITVISDYMAELELVYLHLTDFSSLINVYPSLMDLTLSGRAEVLINNLNYMIPERFVDELNFVVRLHSEKQKRSETKNARALTPRSALPRSQSAALIRRGYANEGSDGLRVSSGISSSTRRPLSQSAILPSNSPRGSSSDQGRGSFNFKALPSSPAFDSDSTPDISIIVEPDDDIVSLDDNFSVANSEDYDSVDGDASEEPSEEDSVTTLDIAVLDGLKFTLTQDLMRHLVELYQIFTRVQQESTTTSEASGDSRLLHFQYVLVNRCDLPIRYWQTNTDDAKVLKPGEESYFTFSNPYQLKRLEIEMAGWSHMQQAFSPDEVGSMVFRLTQLVGAISSSRDLIVSIQPRGLKRYVEFLPTHHVVNDTDKVLLLRITHSQLSYASLISASTEQILGSAESTTEYMIAPHLTVPISCAMNHDGKRGGTGSIHFSAAFGDGAWEFSRPLPISPERPESITDTLKTYSQDGRSERWLLCTTTREPYTSKHNDRNAGGNSGSGGGGASNNGNGPLSSMMMTDDEEVEMTTLHFAAPVVIENLCVFPLEYYFPSMLPRRPRARQVGGQGIGVLQGPRSMNMAIYDDEDELADSIASILPANSTTYFFFDTFRHRELCCRLAGYSVWSGRIQVERVQYSSVELYKAADECIEGEKDDILISCFIYGRHHDFARRLAFNTQFLFVNDTDMLLFVRQQNTLPMTQIAPRQMTPFSWVRGSSKMLSINMGNTAWSPPVDISVDAFQRIEIKVPNFDVSYMFLMESHTLDMYSRAVAWRSWFHIRNHSSYDLKFYLKGKSSPTILPDDYDSLPTFELDDEDLAERRRTNRTVVNAKRQSKRQNGHGKPNGDYALLLEDEDDIATIPTSDMNGFADEEAYTGQTAPGSLKSDFMSPLVRNTVFGNVHITDEGWVVIPRHSNTTSGLCPDVLGLTIAKDYTTDDTPASNNPNAKVDNEGEKDGADAAQGHSNAKTEAKDSDAWGAVEIPTTTQSAYSVPIALLSDPRVYRALDVSVTTDEKGLYITITDNRDPPFIVANDTPFAVRLRRQEKAVAKTKDGETGSSTETPKTSARLSQHLASATTSDEYLIEPNSSLSLFAGGLGNEDDFEYRASVLTPEEHARLSAANKALASNAEGATHGRKYSGGNLTTMGISAATIQGHRRNLSGSGATMNFSGPSATISGVSPASATSTTPEMPELISPTVANRSKRHSLISGGTSSASGVAGATGPAGTSGASNTSLQSITSGSPATASSLLPTIVDEEEDLLSAMDGDAQTDDEDGVDFENYRDEDDLQPSSSTSATSSAAPRSRRMKKKVNMAPLPTTSPSGAIAKKSTVAPILGFSNASPDLAPSRRTLTSIPTISGHDYRTHHRANSGGGMLSPRATIALAGGFSDSPDIFVSGSFSAATAPVPKVDARLSRQFRQHFAPTMDQWSKPFSLREALEFSIEWIDRGDSVTMAWSKLGIRATDSPTHTLAGGMSSHSPNQPQDAPYRSSSNLSGAHGDMGGHSATHSRHGSHSFSAADSLLSPPALDARSFDEPNMLLVTSQPQGKTRVVKISLSPVSHDTTLSEEDESHNKKNAVVRRVMKVDLLLPEVQVLMLTAESRDAAASVRLQKVQLEVSQFSNMQHSVFFVIQHAEANTLYSTAEYPVLFAVDRRALHGAHPRFMEFLVEWNVRNDRTFIDYIGLRVLPFVLQLDSEILDSIQDVQNLLAPLFGAKSAEELEEEENEKNAKAAVKALLANASDAAAVPNTVDIIGTQNMNPMNSHQYGASSSVTAAATSLNSMSSFASSLSSAVFSSLTSAANVDLATAETIEEYGAAGRVGLGDSGKFGGGFFYSGAADRELTDNNPAAPRNRFKLNKLLSQHTDIQQDQFEEEKQILQENFLYVGRLEIFPLRVTLSIGTNTKHWPVISEAQMSLASFSRNDLSESIGTLFSTLGSAYSTLVWAEIYQIIGNLDAIASPLQNLRKLATGVNDFFKLPLEGLVLDDTPGAYIVGLGYGTTSLLLNFTDFLLTVLMKSFQTLSWVTQVISLDEDHQKVKDRVARQHPTNVVYGMGQGVRECARGFWEGASGLVTLPVRGVQRHGAVGFFSGVGKSVLGLPLKPIGGVFDLFSKTFEGLLQTLGRGYLLQERAENSLVRPQLPEGEIRENIQKFIAMRDQRILIVDDARFIRHGRPLERYIVLTFHALYIINVNKMHFDDYSPKKIPIGLINHLIVPVSPETQMVVRLHPNQQLWGQDSFLFIVPDRKHFILKMAARFGIKSMEVAKLEKFV